MLFQKNSIKPVEEINELAIESNQSETTSHDDVETVVGPSVNVEGDLSSNGNIIVKGSVIGSVNTSRMLTAEKGSKIIANVKAGSALIAGEIKGNVKIKDSLELTSTSRVLGDISVKTLTVEPGAVICGKITMPGIEIGENKGLKSFKRNRKDESEELIV